MSASNAIPAPNSEQDVILIELAMRYLDGRIRPQELAQLDEQLGRQAKARDQFVAYCIVARSLREALGSKQQAMCVDNAEEQASDPNPLLLAAAELEAMGDPTNHNEDGDHDQVESVQVDAVFREVLDQEIQNWRNRKAQAAEQAQRQADETAQRRRRLRMLAGQSDFDATPVRHVVIPKAVFYGAVAAIAALLAVLVYPWVMIDKPSSPSKTQPIAVAPEPPVVLAQLDNAVGLRWAQTSATHQVGDALLQGRYEISEGLIELGYPSGAVLIVEAPAVFELQNKNTLNLLSGKLVGRCATPQSRGFVVTTPSAVTTDLSTEFGVQTLHAGQTQVVVYDGNVQVASNRPSSDHAPQSMPMRELVAGQAVEVDQQTIKTIEPNALRLARRLPTPHEYAVRQLAPLIYFSFEDIADGQRSIPNQGQLDVVGRINGQFESTPINPHNHAVLLDGRSYAQIDYQPSLDQPGDVTISAWIQPDRKIERVGRVWSNHSLAGGYSFGVLGDGNPFDLQVGTVVFTNFTRQDYVSADSIPFDQWSHVAITVSAAGKPQIYIDGQPVRTRLITGGFDHAQSAPLSLSDHPFTVGRNPIDFDGFKYWIGGIDELTAFNRALSYLEIQTLYDATGQAMNDSP